MTESCRLVTTEQYKEYQLLKIKLDTAIRALIVELNDTKTKQNQIEATLKEIEEVK